MDITNSVSAPVLGFLVALTTLVLTILGLIYRRGGKDRVVDIAVSDVAQVKHSLDELKTRRDKDREKDRMALEGHLAALHGGMALLKDQFQDFRTDVSRIYATKDSVVEVERRAEASRDRIYKTLDDIRDKLDRALEAKLIRQDS